MRRIEKSEWDHALEAADPDRRRLCLFASRHALQVDLLEISGIHLAMAHVSAQRQIATASGSGFDAARAIMACLGEAAEFASWRWREEDSRRILAGSRPAPLTKIDARRVLGFSDRQIAERRRLNRIWSGWDRIPPAAMQDDPPERVCVRNFDGTAEASCPAFLVFGGFGARHGDATLDADSNGCAAGPTLDAAKISGLLELIERDATGLWWHRGLIAPRYERNRIADPVLRHAVETHRKETGRRLWFLDISPMRQAAVIAAVSCQVDGARMMLGFGAALDIRGAARSAFRELVQSETALDAWEQRRSEGRPTTAEDCRIARWLRHSDVRRMRFVIGESADWPRSAESRPDALLCAFRDIFGEPWFADLTRPDIGVPVVKAVAEGLAHFKPRHGVRRLSESIWTDRATRTPKALWSPLKLLV